MLLQLSQESTQAGEPGAHRALGRLVVRWDLSQRQEVKSQLEGVGREMTGSESRHGSLWALCSPGPWGWGYCSPHFARPSKDGVAGVMGEGDYVLRPWEGKDRRVADQLSEPNFPAF